MKEEKLLAAAMEALVKAARIQHHLNHASPSCPT